MKFLLFINWLVLISTALSTPPSWAEELQRLFTTPEERNLLNENRFRPPPPPPTAEELETFELPDPPRFITFNGIIQLNELTTIWVNDSTQLTNKSFSVQPNTDATISIILPKAKRQVRLRPGQTLDTANHVIFEAYQRLPSPNTVNPAFIRGWLRKLW